ncbi:RsmB/NOP family class I SAM-dependent RNA methyltransferase [Sphingomonas sp. RIT328]|uniref:RsmB/NOP family class I SAM-dependent RNA methyltransferase n=1 Tax=Sphingomonas sp. RIT328 TaxID=1470591 RepID=UPI0004489590|nr:RsmB/NOP family class I SAM-dependent RNA methyltransferase [Sphingomonas sp. RIT328]EZP49083.1 NOL1/NOP2/sun family protein [Sphingomonas sp. RIT328]
MTPGARTQAAIELLDAVIDAARGGGAAADTLIARYFATRRYAGSKDRRAVRDLVYAAIRRAGEVPASGRAAMLAVAAEDAAVAATFDGSTHAPAPIAAGEDAATGGIMPAWLAEALAASGIDADAQAALIDRAPLDIRVNRLRNDPAALAARLGGTPIAGLPDALRLPTGTNLDALDGEAEVQDAGSQIVSLAVQAVPGQRIVDLCAGGGGKTLALAAAMRNDGQILATDVDRGRLSRLMPRAERAGVDIVATRLLDPRRELEALADWQGQADAVLIDAPCSGTGTWRRNPEARWRLTPARLAAFTAQQRHVLDVGAALVRPGGGLVYVTCSLLDVEGADQVAAFLAAHPDWRAEPLDLPAGSPRGQGVRLDPARDATDGFFVARLIRPC